LDHPILGYDLRAAQDYPLDQARADPRRGTMTVVCRITLHRGASKRRSHHASTDQV
jgi:hypothetical protein